MTTMIEAESVLARNDRSPAVARLLCAQSASCEAGGLRLVVVGRVDVGLADDKSSGSNADDLPLHSAGSARSDTLPRHVCTLDLYFKENGVLGLFGHRASPPMSWVALHIHYLMGVKS